VVIFCLPFTPAGVYFGKHFSWSSVNYAPIVTIAVMAAVTLWYVGWARRTFKGPIRTIDLSGAGPVTSQPRVAPARPTVE
jgi:hypothetical protein